MSGAASPYAITARPVRASSGMQIGVWLALVLPAEQQHGRPRHAAHRDERRRDVRRLGIVDPRHAVELADRLDAMLERRERR